MRVLFWAVHPVVSEEGAGGKGVLLLPYPVLVCVDQHRASLFGTQQMSPPTRPVHSEKWNRSRSRAFCSRVLLRDSEEHNKTRLVQGSNLVLPQTSVHVAKLSSYWATPVPQHGEAAKREISPSTTPFLAQRISNMDTRLGGWPR